MSVNSEINRITSNIAAAYSKVSSKGGILPATQNSANLANAIDSITGGGATIISTDNGDGTQNIAITDNGTAVSLVPKTITQNGTYTPASDNADGYSSVVVNVQPTLAFSVTTTAFASTSIQFSVNSCPTYIILAAYSSDASISTGKQCSFMYWDMIAEEGELVYFYVNSTGEKTSIGYIDNDFNASYINSQVSIEINPSKSIFFARDTTYALYYKY